MVDIFDKAAELEQLERESCLQQALNDSNKGKPSRSHCKDCDAPIEEKRRALGGVLRCIECDGFFNQEQMQKGLR